MSHRPFMLLEKAGKVLVTRARNRPWSVGDPYRGLEVTEKGPLAELTASFYFVLPEIVSYDGVLSLLTIARGLPGTPSEPPEFVDSAALLEVQGGVYVQVTYDPLRSCFEIRMNAGSEFSELVGVTLGGAPPETVCGRLLELYVEVNAERIFASVHDHFLDDGDVAFDGQAPSTGEDGRPWGAELSGCWWVFVGMPDVEDERSSLLPAGFGLSDLRIALGSEVSGTVGSLAYQGALDHLAAARPVPPQGLFPAWEVRALLRHARSLRAIADDLDRIRLMRPLTDSMNRTDIRSAGANR